MRSSHTIFPATTSQPGEYGSGEGKNGWIVIHLPELNHPRIFITSKYFCKQLSKLHEIPETHIATMIATQGHKHSVSEERLNGHDGLKTFRRRLSKLHEANGDIIIHCHKGVNRSPVAAVIYLIDRGIPPKDAKRIVTKAFRAQRDPSFILNSREHYTDVLTLIEYEYHENLKIKKSFSN